MHCLQNEFTFEKREKGRYSLSQFSDLLGHMFFWQCLQNQLLSITSERDKWIRHCDDMVGWLLILLLIWHPIYLRTV